MTFMYIVQIKNSTLMGEFNIYNEILDFSDFIHLFLNKGKKITLEKNEYFCRAEENFPFVAYLEKGAFR